MESQSTLQWGILHRAAFRFVFVYLILYTAPVPLAVSDSLVKWTGRYAFGLTITILPAGSGDTTWNYVQVFLLAAAALSLTLLWSVLDRGRPNYHRLHGWLHTWTRYSLGMALIGYGMSKLIKSQFPFPDITRLAEAYGDSSPMGLLWTFMGYSQPYNVFTGLAEFVPGLLLFYRRTATLGALLGAAVMVNIVALNFCFDVPVKLYSLHLLALAVFVFLPDAGRLLHVLITQRPVPSREFLPLLKWRQVLIGWQVVKTALLITGLGHMVNMSLSNSRTYGDNAPKPPLYGSYRLTEYRQRGKPVPVVLGDTQMWRQLNIGRVYRANGLATAQTMAGHTVRLGYKVEGQRVKIGETNYSFSTPETNVLLLEDSVGVMRFLKTPVQDYLLVNRGFHWINEYPFSR